MAVASSGLVHSGHAGGMTAMTAMTWWRDVALDAWAIVAPVNCAGCSAPDRALCTSCRLELRPRPLRGVLESPGEARVAEGAALPIVAGLPYDGVARRAVLQLKHGRTELARPLAPALLAAAELLWATLAPGAITEPGRAALLVPVPGSAAGAAQRGFEPATVLALRAGLQVARGLRRAPRARDAQQKSRALAARLERDAAQWRVSARLAGRRVVLLDDVVTSGGTLRAAARALRNAGAEPLGCVALAATPRRAGESSIHWKFCGDHDERLGDSDARQDYGVTKEA